MVDTTTTQKNAGDEKLQRLQSKASEWHALCTKKKLEYIQSAMDALTNSLPLIDEMTTIYQNELRNVNGEEFDMYHSLDALIFAAGSKDIIDAFLESYKVLAGESKNPDSLKKLETKVSGNGQVMAKIFPLTPGEKGGGQAKCVGQVFFQNDKVKSVDDVHPFRIDSLQSDKPGVCVVLGAGNFPVLTISDVLHQLFYKNQVVLVKQHELRGALDKVLRFIFQALYEDGYLDSELNMSVARSAELVYSPCTSGVHLTGGKPAHDAIIWGATPDERQKRMRSNDPKFKGTMTSELGAVTPYIITPVNYTEKELNHQAAVLLSGKWVNGGHSCNSPQVVVMSDAWEQRASFMKKLKDIWTNMHNLVVYYPGTQDRVDAFSFRYADKSTTWMGKVDVGAKSNHMPLLVIELDVDLSSEEGRKAAAKEYAFQTEAFGPVLVLATIKSTGEEPSKFMEDAVSLSNDYLFGSLSCSLMMPEKLKTERFIEKTVEDLKYGGITINSWSGVNYSMSFGTWGAFPGEKLESVESGIDFVHNCLFLPHIEKTVFWRPIIDETANFDVMTKPRRNQIQLYKAVPKFVLQPNLIHLLGVLSAVIGPAIYVVPAVLTAVVAVGANYLVSRR